jgi:hypothetical protein
VPSEAAIETRLIRNREAVLGIQKSLYIRRCRMGPDYGVADLVILPEREKHKLVIVEAKRVSSADAKIKVVGQLLMYYAGALEFGLHGVRLLRDYAAKNSSYASSRHRSSLRAISGGIASPRAAWAALCKGRRLRPDNIRLVAALDSAPGLVLTRVLTALYHHHGLEVSVISVVGRNDLRLWRPGHEA